MLHSLRMLAYRAKYLYGKDLKAPVDVSLELSSHCNQRCVYCYHADQASLPFDRKIMSFSTASKILDQAAELGVNSVKFNWRGESTMNPNYHLITRRAKQLARGSTFIDRVNNSNFKFVDKHDEILEGLCNLTKVKVSFDSFRKDIFEKQRAGGIYELALRNVDRFYHHQRRTETELVLQAVRTKLNADEDIEGFVKKRWPSATVSVRDVVEGRVDKDLSGLKPKARSEERQSCRQAHVRLIFDHAGRAFPCCPDIGGKLALGDINQQSLHAIFNSIAANRLRADLKSGEAFKLDPCKSCPSFESYKGYKAPWTS